MKGRLSAVGSASSLPSENVKKIIIDFVNKTAQRIVKRIVARFKSRVEKK